MRGTLASVWPQVQGDYAFLLHDLLHLKPDSIMTIALPRGVLFRGGDEGCIRKKLAEDNNIDAITWFSSNNFFGTGIPSIIMVRRQKPTEASVLMVDVSKGFEKVGMSTHLRASGVLSTRCSRVQTGVSRSVDCNEIRHGGHRSEHQSQARQEPLPVGDAQPANKRADTDSATASFSC